MILQNLFCSLAILDECVNFEDVVELLLRRDAPYIAQLLQSNLFSNVTGSRIITNHKPEVTDDVHCFLYPEEPSMLCLKSTKATPTAAQATSKGLKKISRENQCFNSNSTSSR